MDAAKFEALCAKLGFDDLSADELERVLKRASEPPPMMGPMAGGPPKIDLDAALAHAGCGPFSLTPTPSEYTISGTVAPGYEAVKAAFESNYQQGLERNSQLCIYKDGQAVVDLWGENTETETTRPPAMNAQGLPRYSTAPAEGYDGDTLQIVYSSTKAMAATVFALAADRGLLAYDDKVAKHWPEFAQNGKEDITIADVLRHDAGLQAFDEAITLEDTELQADPSGNMSRIIAAQKPWAWRGGPDEGLTPRIYHAISRGFILNQILLRADPQRRTIGQWMHAELCGPLGADFYCGSSGTPERFAWLQKPEAQMVQPSPNFVFANSTVPTAVAREVERYDFPLPDQAAALAFMRSPNYKYHPNVDQQAKGGAGGVGFVPTRPGAHRTAICAAQGSYQLLSASQRSRRLPPPAAPPPGAWRG